MRWNSFGIGTTLMACLLPCCGCGGSLEDAPANTKGPTLSKAKTQQMEELKAKAKNADVKEKGTPRGRSPR
jgi:hypothetical protein